jgi:hypothetical protein
MRTCKEAAALMSKAERSRLPTGEWFGLHLHLLICSLCRGHRRNNRILSRAMRLLLSRRNAFLTLPASARQRIALALKRADSD